MKDYLGLCFFMLLTASVCGEERPPGIPASAVDVSNLLQNHLAQLEGEAFCARRQRIRVFWQAAVVEGKGSWAAGAFDQVVWHSETIEPRIEYLMSAHNGEDWQLKAVGEIQLYPPPGHPQSIFEWGCILINR